MRREWSRRVEAEYGSAAIAQHLTLWLIQIGASPDLIRTGLRIVDDELVHAGECHQVVVACGAGAIMLDRDRLALQRHPGEPLEHDVLRACLSVFCLGETVAVPLFRALRDGCSVPLARRVLTRVLRDEVRHREFGWTLLEWLVALPLGAALITLAERELPAMLASVRDSYAPAHSEPCSGPERAWGLMPGASYREVFERTVEREYVPRFARLQIRCAG